LDHGKFESLHLATTPPTLSVINNYAGLPFKFDTYSQNSGLPIGEVVRHINSFPTSKMTMDYLDFSTCKALVNSLAVRYDKYSINNFRSALSFVNPSYLGDLLEHIEKIFFGKFPNGRIIVIKSNQFYYKRAGLIRFLYTLSNYPELFSNPAEIRPEFRTLHNWNSFEAHELIGSCLHLCENFTFPYINGFHSNHKLGTHFVFIPNRTVKISTLRFPVDRQDFIRTAFSFGEEKSNHTTESNRNKYFAKYCFKKPLSLEKRIDLFETTLTQVNHLIRDLLDITKFKDSESNIDPVYAFEYSNSILTLMKVAISILHTNHKRQNTDSLFRVLDMISGIANRRQFGCSNDAEFFKMMLSKNEGYELLENVIQNSKLLSKNELGDALKTIYDDLHDTVLNSVFVPDRLADGVVSVKTRNLDGNMNISEQDFVSDVVRSLRNTHHGYLTREDRNRKGPARFLSLIDGNFPASITSLGPFVALGILLDREALMGSL